MTRTETSELLSGEIPVTGSLYSSEVRDKFKGALTEQFVLQQLVTMSKFQHTIGLPKMPQRKLVS